MSEPVRIAAAVEGPTDEIVLRAILDAVLADTEYEFQTLQPEGSVAFGSAQSGETGVGWVGVYRWSRQSVLEGGGSVSGSSALAFHDVLIVHVDADVAGRTYASGDIHDATREDLPCKKHCPPAAATTNALRAVILNWLGEPACPPRVVLCTPSKNIENWVVAAVWPDNREVMKENWECRENAEGQLGTLPKSVRFGKRSDDYRRKHGEIAAGWLSVAARLSEARRFDRELRAAVPI